MRDKRTKLSNGDVFPPHPIGVSALPWETRVPSQCRFLPRGICCHRVYVRPSVCLGHKPVLCRNDWTNRAGIWYGGFKNQIFLFSNFIASYQQTMTFTSGLFVVKSFVAVCFDNSCEQ